MLQIKNLHAQVEEKSILKGISLTVNPGEVHAIMGPNGSGKSTLASVLAGRDGYEITDGEVNFLGEDLLDMDPEVRAAKGLFLAFQYPVEIPGVSNTYFLRAAVNAVRKQRGESDMDAMEFMKYIREKIKLLELDPSLLNRSVNEGFSGGEKKRNEIAQLELLNPKFAILDETDSGLDIDALRIVSEGVNRYTSAGDRGLLLITHYTRILNYITPDFVHVFVDGRVAEEGGPELADSLEIEGYDRFVRAVKADA